MANPVNDDGLDPDDSWQHVDLPSNDPRSDDLNLYELDRLMDSVTILTDLRLTSDWPEDDLEALDSGFQKLMAQYVRKVKQS